MNFKITILIMLIAGCVELGSCADIVTDLQHNVVNLIKDCASGSKPCVVKCCGENEVIRKKKRKYACKDINSVMKEVNGSDTLLYQLTNYPEMKINSSGKASKAFKKDFNLLQSKKFAENMNSLAILTPYDEPLVTFMENGDLKISSTATTRRAPRFCVDMVVKTRKGIPDNETYIYFIENDDRSVERNNIQFNIYGYIVTSVFISLVLLVYGLLKDLHGCVNGLLLMAFIATLMIYYSSQAYFYKYQINLNLSGIYLTESYYDICTWIKPLNYFLLLSTLTWLNTLSFDIWLQFRKIKRPSRIPRAITPAIIKKFIRYLLYAWGLPIAMTVTAILIDKLAADDSVKPALISCKHNNDYWIQQKMYKFIPLAILLFTNVLFYLMTVRNIWLVNRDSKRLNQAKSFSRKNINQFKLFSKMFVIMGLGWIIDLVQILLKEDLEPWLFYLLNAYSAYIGVIIFIAMVCKRHVFNMLCNRLGIENRWTRRNAHNKSSTRTDTSKVSKSRARDDSINIESTQFSDADTKKDNQRNPLQNPEFTVSKTRTEL